MFRFAMTISLCLLCACRSERSESVVDTPQDATFVLPGTFSKQTTVADLQRRFGKANVRITSEPDGSSDSRPRVVLFPDDPTRRAYVSFHDADTLTILASISVRDAGSRWRGKHGIHIGMPFAELRRVNGKPFGFSGFNSEHRGWAHDQWSLALDDEDSRLGALDVDEGEHMSFGVNLGLRGQVENIPAGAYPHDDVSLSSDDPRYPRLGELVEVVGITASTSLDDESS